MFEASSRPVSQARSYRDFTLAFGPASDDSDPDRFEVRLPDTPGCELGTTRPFRLPFRPDSCFHQIEEQIRAPSEHSRVPRALGGALFDALFTGTTRESFLVARSEVERGPEAGLRIRLLIDPQRPGGRTLCSLPWELLHRHETREDLALSRMTPVVRQLSVPRGRRPASLEESLRIAVVVASPRDQQPLTLARERERIEEICRETPGIQIEVLRSASPDVLRQALRSRRFHGLHFMGHGQIEPESGAGALVFADEETGVGVPISGEVLATMLRDCPELRFVVLNACDSGHLPRHEGQDPYTGVATALVMAGLPAVVARHRMNSCFASLPPNTRTGSPTVGEY